MTAAIRSPAGRAAPRVGGLALFAALVSSMACAPGGPSERKPATPPSPAAVFRSDPAALARGKALFGGTCTGYCHSTEPGGKGAPDLFDCDWLHGGSDAEIFQTLTTGVPDTRMVSFAGKLSDDDLWKIIAFLRSASRCPR